MTTDMVRKILESAAYDPRARNWTVQGFGMLRCYLDDGQVQRLHIWTAALRVPGVSDIHTLPWEFDSTVFAGRIINKRYMEARPHTPHTIPCLLYTSPSPRDS